VWLGLRGKGENKQEQPGLVTSQNPPPTKLPGNVLTPPPLMPFAKPIGCGVGVKGLGGKQTRAAWPSDKPIPAANETSGKCPHSSPL